MLARTELPLLEATLRKLYLSKNDYVERLNQRLGELVAEGWFLPEYVESIRRDLQATAIP
jgi:hypothetical protein